MTGRFQLLQATYAPHNATCSLTTGTVDVTNSFAIPFEEDAKEPKIFYLDHNFLENMYDVYVPVMAPRIAT